MKVDADYASNIAKAVNNDAEELREELTRIVGRWENLSANWSGTAASAYTAIWQEWHEGAATVVDSLAESATSLAEAAVRYDAQDADSADQLSSTAIEMGL